MDESDRVRHALPEPMVPCGRCGELNLPAAITCEACGGLLAAYQAPAGAVSSASSATGSTFPDITLPPPPAPGAPPPVHRPRSMSPIGDALRRPALTPELAAEDLPVSPDRPGAAPVSAGAGQVALYRGVTPAPARHTKLGKASRPVMEPAPVAAPGPAHYRRAGQLPGHDAAVPRRLPPDRSADVSAAAVDWYAVSAAPPPVRLSGAMAGTAWLLSAVLLGVIRWVVWQGRSEPGAAIVAGLALSILVLWWVARVTSTPSVPVFEPAPTDRSRFAPATPVEAPPFSPDPPAGSITRFEWLVGALMFGGIGWLMWQGRSVPRGTIYLGIFLSAIVVWWLSERSVSRRKPPGP